VPEAEFIIDSESGEFRIHVRGVAGPTCDDIARLVNEFTGPPGSEERTSEYYLRPATRVRPDARVRPKHT
jgi:Protein of unknown function (DUF2997)